MNAETFHYQVIIKEHHLDTFGHVNNATYLELYEEARWEFITANGYGLKDIMAKEKGPVILNINVSFNAEIKNREVIKIESKLIKMKNDLVIVLEQKMIKEDGKMASKIELEIGLMDLVKRKLIRSDEQWLAALGISQY